MKKFFKYFFILIGCFLLTTIVYLFATFPPIMAGMAAKTMCSCVYVMGRSPQSVVEKELSVFPGLSSAKMDFADSSSVTASVAWATGRAIYRPGLGCTVLSERSEDDVRDQQIDLGVKPMVDQDTMPWPSGNILSDSVIVGLDRTMINSAIDEAFSETNPEKPKNTLAVLIVYNGHIVGERYAAGLTINSMLMGWSMTKSITSTLIGLRVKDGKLNIEEFAPVPEWQNDERKFIKLTDLLRGSSGLEWNESYFLPGDFHNMFMFSDDKGGYAASKELEHKPNTFFEYSSGTANLLSKIVRVSVGDSLYYRYPYERLFYKIGMYHTMMEPDASGTYVGSSYGYASARDWARFGLLFLNDGLWNGERILPDGWVDYATTPAPAAPMGEYGAQWWLNAGTIGNPAASYHPGLPNEEYGAEGFEHQNVMVIPSKKLVIVRLGISHHGFDITSLVNKSIAALPKK